MYVYSASCNIYVNLYIIFECLIVVHNRKMANGGDDDEGEAALIEDEASEDSASSRSQCTFCHRSMPVTRLGLIRVHGPVLNRCPGSRRPPAPVNTCQRGNIPDIADPVQAFKLRMQVLGEDPEESPSRLP